eukprot:TRINITY_DN27826_c0_g1_i1.p1 TRINITY_DN27826_c0_g1~~TRINITY_DN27826_c0_g1_i1.p1  ORF type:complete len:463 (+),score=96.94 TRINITY_DN27826_c0_g1_i1:88-1476(+)
MALVGSSNDTPPGARGFVHYGGAREPWHERLFLWPTGANRWITLSPDGDMYEEQLGADFAECKICKAAEDKPEGLGRRRLYRFDHGLGDFEMKDLIRQGRGEYERLRAAHARAETFEPGLGVNWAGSELVLEEGWMDGLRRRLGAGGAAAHVRVGGDGAVVAGGATSDLFGTDDLHVWVFAEPAGGVKLGQEVLAGERPKKLDENNGVVYIAGHWVRVERILVAEASSFASVRAKALAAELGVERTVVGDGDAGDLHLRRALLGRDSGDLFKRNGDVRTLEVSYDGQGARYKEWRAVCVETHEEPFIDWPVDGPRTVVDFAKHMEKHGRTPTGWLERWCADKGIQKSDRVYHEVRNLAEVFEFAGVYDCLNVGSMGCLELLVRRWQTILEAYEVNPTRPNWDNARYFSGLGSSVDGIVPSLKTYVAKKAKEDADVEKARQKVRELKGAGAAAGAKSAAAGQK